MSHVACLARHIRKTRLRDIIAARLLDGPWSLRTAANALAATPNDRLLGSDSKKKHIPSGLLTQIEYPCCLDNVCLYPAHRGRFGSRPMPSSSLSMIGFSVLIVKNKNGPLPFF